ncbi:MAG: hypothetical protein JRN15_05985 [Nitrososphaerota archaeon]|jgi:hypothetical protein|nr:hypothetical protein [Nitrososphaerota archaeon]
MSHSYESHDFALTSTLQTCVPGPFDPLAKAVIDANIAIFQLIVCDYPLITMENMPEEERYTEVRPWS